MPEDDIRDDVQQTDATDRTAAALEQWNNPNAGDQATPADDAAANPNADGASDKPPERNVGASTEDNKPGDGAEADITKAAFFNDPVFQQHYKQSEEWRQQNEALHKIMDGGRYKIDSTATLEAVHNDAFTLYDIAAGKAKVDALLDLFEKNWDPQVFKDVLTQMVAYAGKKGVGAGAGDGDSAGDETPQQEEVRELRARLDARDKTEAEQKQRADEERQFKERMDKEVLPLQTKVTELCKAKGLTEKEDIEDYAVQVADRIGRMEPRAKEKVIEQIRAGKWGEVERIFTEYHNLMVNRAKRHADSVANKEKERADSIPRVPTGGANPPKREARRDLRTSDGRTTAAMDEWNRSKQ